MRNGKTLTQGWIIVIAAAAAFAGVLAAPTPGRAQMAIQLQATLKLDAKGDGAMELKTQYPAKLWLLWKANYGDHPDLILRDLHREFACYEFSDYKLEKDDVNRVAVAKLKGTALARYQRDGTYAVEVPPPARYVAQSGNEWVFDHKVPAGPRAPEISQTTRVVLPDGASGATLQNAGNEYQAIVYAMPHTARAGGGLLIASLILGLVGLILAGGAFLVPATVLPRELPPPPPPPPALMPPVIEVR